MSPRAAIVGLAALLVTAGACGRSGVRPAPTVTPVVDTAAERLAREAAAKAHEDSIRVSGAVPVAPPATPTTVVAPKPVPKATPERRCVLDLPNTPSTHGLRVVDPVTKKAFTYASGGIVGNCRGQNITITADSLESYEATDLHILIGNVKYREAKYAIDAQRVTYFKAEERLLFQENVHAVMTKDAATLDGPQLEYFRPVTGLRDRERVVATQRPKLTYIEKDSAGKEQPPMTILGNSIIGEGDSTFFATGDVRIERTDVIATGDSAMVDGGNRFSRLLKKPVVESKGARPFTLKGRVIEMYGEAKQVDRIVSIDSANAVSDNLNVTADTIDLRVANSKLNRAFAFGPSGARATTPERDIIADSLDIVMPNQRIQELHAVGKAFAESDPDTMKVMTDERDWIRGDTLIALFDSVTKSDTSGAKSDTSVAKLDTAVAKSDTTQPPIRELFASGDASAYYQVASDSTQRSKPGINYVTGRMIRLTFKDNEVETVTVTDQASGIYLEPVRDTAAARRANTRPPAKGPAPIPTPPRRPPSDPLRNDNFRWRP